jgi:hypothetical protein
MYTFEYVNTKYTSDKSDGDSNLVGHCPVILSLTMTSRTAISHLMAKFLTLPHRLDEERVENDEQREWQ